MLDFTTNESSEDSFTLTASKPTHLSTSNYIVLQQATQVQTFTAAQFSGVKIYAVDHNNAQLLLNGIAFQGFLLNANDQQGLGNITLPTGQWWVGVVYGGTALSGNQTVSGFDEVSTVSLAGASFLNNVPMGVSGDAGAWRSQGFSISGTPSLYIETEASGGKFFVQTAAQYQAFQAAYANGYNGGSYSYVYALGGTSGGPATEIEGQVQLSAGSYYLTWINDTGSWAGGAADISAFTSSGGGNVATGAVNQNGNGSTTPATATKTFQITHTQTGVKENLVPTAYSGPVSGVNYQYINITAENLNILPTMANSFIHSGSGVDAIDVSGVGGRNVLDGGTNSNFLVGAPGTGWDSFFVDDRSATADIWSTIVNFHQGDDATVWGVTAKDFTLQWIDGQGAAGYQGLTLHVTAPGKPTASLTLTGYVKTDLSNGRLSTSFGTTPDGNNYMYIHGN